MSVQGRGWIGLYMVFWFVSPQWQGVIRLFQDFGPHRHGFDADMLHSSS